MTALKTTIQVPDKHLGKTSWISIADCINIPLSNVRLVKSTAKREEGKGIEGVVGIGKVCCHVRVSRNWEEFWDWVDTSGLQLRGTCDLGL